MPNISVTQEEYDAFIYFQSETMDKVESTSNEEYIADYVRHSDHLMKFRHKFHKAKNREDSQKLVKKALRIARSRKSKSA
ncbi:hypothetical protein [Acinetobacter junii]|uniref:hypothetical protein n=1 Tax=Acinetobacter junii TaxID=40215 RepID=UPI0009503EFE|nr:hypothetical protein [Acinetobacter junii]APU48392.1 hypothetical protein BVL33_07745 [Acinetobacter junii]MQZ56985.1 hypothetical protein [Acinetobacter junii]